jgi:hypothetical protein
VSLGDPSDPLRMVPGAPSYHYGAGQVFRTRASDAKTPVLNWCPEVIERQDLIQGTAPDDSPLILRSNYLVQVGSTELLVTMDSMKSGKAWEAIPVTLTLPLRGLRNILIGIVRDQAMTAPAVQVQVDE